MTLQQLRPPPAPAATGLVRRLLAGHGTLVALGAVLVLLVVVEALRDPAFATTTNLTSIMRAAAVPVVLALGMTIVLLTGGVDLSIGSMLALTGTIYATLVTAGTPGQLALPLTVVSGAVVGFLINGVLIGVYRVSFFVVTLGTLSVLRGVVYFWTDSRTVDMYADRVSSWLGNDVVADGLVPVGLVAALALGVVLHLVLRYTTYGRSLYAVGGNREAAELSGVRAGWVVASAYAVSGAAAGLAAVLTIGGATIADPNMGSGAELQAVAAALLGGVALSGGAGSVWGALLGVAFFEVMSNALALAGASAAWQLIVTGSVLVIAITVDRARQGARRRRRPDQPRASR